MSNPVAGTGKQLHGGKHQSGHRFIASGKRRDHPGPGLTGICPEFVHDRIRKRGMLFDSGQSIKGDSRFIVNNTDLISMKTQLGF